MYMLVCCSFVCVVACRFFCVHLVCLCVVAVLLRSAKQPHMRQATCESRASTSARGRASISAARANCASSACLFLRLCTVKATRPHSAAPPTRLAIEYSTVFMVPSSPSCPCSCSWSWSSLPWLSDSSLGVTAAAPMLSATCVTAASTSVCGATISYDTAMSLPAAVACRASACLLSVCSSSSSAASFSFHSRKIGTSSSASPTLNAFTTSADGFFRRKTDASRSVLRTFFRSARGFSFASSLSPVTCMRRPRCFLPALLSAAFFWMSRFCSSSTNFLSQPTNISLQHHADFSAVHTSRVRQLNFM
eukprot:Rhum_TRINITY_DN8524_c0_g1::Rhum_TRINITY_DN8524_c0_g1_i1::g.28529::m.28529